nr:uncharacterized abhydrolase domain-containing protein DDB_G0269086-like [Aegilops tauschii subsp. strangulata]
MTRRTTSRALDADRTSAGSSTAPTRAPGVPKRRADVGMFGNRPSKKAKASVATTKRQEAAKAAIIWKGPKQRPMVFAALLSLSWAPSASVFGVAGSPKVLRHVDPVAALREATEKNTLEAQQERDTEARADAEVAEAARAKADAAAKAQADAAAKEQADVAAKAQEEEASRGRAPEATGPQHAEPPRPVKAVSVPSPIEVGAVSSSPPGTEATNAASPEWTSGAGSGVLNVAVQNILAQFNTHGATLLQYKKELLARQAAVRDYHNLHAAAYNSQHQELAKRIADLSTGAQAAAGLQKRLGEVESELHTKGQECSQAAQERDRLAKELADQAEVQKLKDSEALLKAEYEAQRSNWAERGKFLSNCYGEIEDMIDEFLPDQSVTVSQATEARCDQEEGGRRRPDQSWRRCAAAITEFTDTAVFVPELDDDGAEVLPNWVGLNPEEGEDSTKEIASSDEGEEDEDEDEEGEDTHRMMERAAGLSRIKPRPASRCRPCRPPPNDKLNLRSSTR